MNQESRPKMVNDIELLWRWVWDEKYWFPKRSDGHQYGWKDIENNPNSNVYYPELHDLHLSFVMGFILLIVRLVLERFIVVPLGYYFGVSRKYRVPVQENAVLEKAYRSKKIADEHYKVLKKETDMTRRQIEVWLRKRKNQDAPIPMKKFQDCSWHFLFYGVAFAYGLTILWPKPWLWQTKYCWIGWPQQHVSEDVYWYYMIELAFYWSLVFTLFTDHKRKDFTEMIIHHVATIVLIYFSWAVNFVRIGTLVLLIHDASDPWLAVAKMCHYCNKKTTVVPFFIGFVIVWIISRLGFFPFAVLYSTTIETYEYVLEKTFFAHWFFNFFLYLLMVLHIMWSISITKIIIKTVKGDGVKDVRSDSDVVFDVDDQENKTNGFIEAQNGHTGHKMKEFETGNYEDLEEKDRSVHNDNKCIRQKETAG